MQTPRSHEHGLPQRPVTSPYFAKPFIKGVRASPAEHHAANDTASRPRTGASRATHSRWSHPRLGEVQPLFDPNISHFSMRRTEGPPTPLSARDSESRRPGTFSSAKSCAAQDVASAGDLDRTQIISRTHVCKCESARAASHRCGSYCR